MREIILPSGLSIATSLDKRRREQIDYQAVIQAAQTIHREQKKREIVQPSAQLKITTADPVVVFTQGDLHIGNTDVNYAELLRQHDAIRGMRNAFLSLTGDILDNGFIFREGGWAENLPYDMQGEVACNLLKDLDEGGKVLWNTVGNHDLFQQNVFPTYFGTMNFPIIGPNHGRVDLQVGEQDYNFFTFHKLSMGSSTMSPLLRCQRALEYFDQDADVLIGGHTHRKVIGQYKLGIDKQKKLRTMIETGTFKPEERFQREQGNLRTANFDYGGAGVILFPDKKEVMPFYDFDQGVEMINGLTGLKSVLTATTSNILRNRG